MITDPVNVNAPGLQEHRVIRGLCLFTSHEDDLARAGLERARDHARFLCRDGGCGLRLSLTLPCNLAGSVVQ